MDPTLGLEAKRLYISTALTMHAARSLGWDVPACSTSGDLLELARRLHKGVSTAEYRYSLRFMPSYPGVSAGVEATKGGVRLTLACEVCDAEEYALGVAFTSLIPGRRPQVSVAPKEAGIPERWRPLDELS